MCEIACITKSNSLVEDCIMCELSWLGCENIKNNLVNDSITIWVVGYTFAS